MDYRKIYAMKKEREEKIKRVCPGIANTSGIYVFYRDDETGLKMAYCGQALHILERCSAHLGEYDHIAMSLKKRGFYSKDNPYGWKLIFKECEVENLDENERATITYFGNKGYQLFNVSSGGQGKGRTLIKDSKPSKGYRDGLKQGRKNLAKELSHIIDKHLVVGLKPEKENNSVSQKAFEKFNELLKGDES